MRRRVMIYSLVESTHKPHLSMWRGKWNVTPTTWSARLNDAARHFCATHNA